MENPIDNSIDLGFVNYVQHPENKQYVVFRFADTNRSKSFEECLNEEKIWFEKGDEEKRGRKYELYAVHQSDYNKAQKLNYKVEGLHKKPIIPFAILRWSLMIFSAFVMTLAIIGYVKGKKHLNQESQKIEKSRQ
jgi:hypothetical protein